MPSSLAAQLAQGASLNAALLGDNTRRKATASYLFSAKEAPRHDLDSLHALGLNGFLQLKTLNPAFRAYEQALFSDAAKSSDRTLQTKEQNAQLDERIAGFLPMLGPYLMDAPAGKVLEWLVRRFRINEFNLKEILSLFLPYHESPHFAKMVTILQIPDQSTFRFLIPYKTKALPTQRAALVQEMSKNSDFLRFVVGLLPSSFGSEAGPHRTLLAFHTGLLLDFIAQQKVLDEGTIAALLPSFLAPLQYQLTRKSIIKPATLQESILGSYLLLAALSQKCHLSVSALRSLLVAVAASAECASPKQFTRVLVAICAPQDSLDALPIEVTDVIVRLPRIVEELKGALVWVGSEKLVNPLATGLVERLPDDMSAPILEALLSFPQILPSTIHHFASLLVSLSVDSPSPDALAQARAILSHIQQRHPQVFQKACQVAMDEDEERRGAYEQVVLSLSVVSTSAGDMNLSAVMASVSADVNARMIAVRELLKMLAEGHNLPANALASVKSSLLTRVRDSDVQVVETLYSRPEVILPLITSDAPHYLSTLEELLHTAKPAPAKKLVRAHLAFLTTHLYDALVADAMLTSELVYRVFFPYLLFSKPREKTASLAWDLLKKAEDDGRAIARDELLAGCVDAMRWGESAKEGTERYVDLDAALTARLADNVSVSRTPSRHIDALLARFSHANPHARNLAYLVLRALVGRLSGVQQLELALRLLDTMGLSTLEGMSDFMRGADDVQKFLGDRGLVTEVVTKPSSAHTRQRLQAALLIVLSGVPRPAGSALSWVAPKEGEDAYVRLVRALYGLSNSTASLPLLSTHILSSLFVALGEDALAFLAGVWLDVLAEADGGKRDYHVVHAALRHAMVFLDAHRAMGQLIDFQTVLPEVLLVLGCSDAVAREEAVGWLMSLTELAKAGQPTGVYAYDRIYGASSSALQYLDLADYRQYLDTLLEAKDYFIQDGTYLREFHRQQLAASPADQRKTAKYKQRVLFYLVSHVNACPIRFLERGLLASLELVVNAAKSQALLPTLERTLAEGAGIDKVGEVDDDLATLAAASLDVSAADDLNDESKPLWAVLKRALEISLAVNVASTKTVLVANLRSGLIARLSFERRKELCHLLLRIGGLQQSTSECKQLLTTMVTDGTLVIQLLQSLQPVAEDTERSSKRARLENPSVPDNSTIFPHLSLFAEVLSAATLPGSLELISCLLDTLGKVALNSTALPADRSYIEQLLLATLDKVVSGMQEVTILPAGAIRLDVLVQLIRVSENPQTSHEALLVIASFARLAPDAVLHNIMPVFTFMGSNVFHRDDSYSFRVVQKTIESIVPVMVASLKADDTQGHELLLASREFLRIFTEASNHIPRHRRLNFFTHLVDVLGPEEFLPPVSMLLVEKVTNRVARQAAQDARASLALALGVLQHYPVARRLAALSESLDETKRLLQEPSEGIEPFLVSPTEDEQAVDLSKRRALALLVFTNDALIDIASTPAKAAAEPSRAHCAPLVSALLDIAVLPGADTALPEIRAAARTAIGCTLRVMPAADFVSAALGMAASPQAAVRTGALELLAERLPRIARAVRQACSAAAVALVEHARKALAARAEAPLVLAALAALRAVSETMCAGEENALAGAVPLVLQCAAEREAAAAAFGTLVSLCAKLGPRIIPRLSEIVRVSASTISDMLRGAWSDREDAPTDVFTVLHGLLSAIPTFWGERELLALLTLYVDASASSPSSSAFASLAATIRALAKHALPKALLPTLCGAWAALDLNSSDVAVLRSVAFFGVVKRAIKAAPRAAVQEQLRPLSKLFYDAFDVSAAAQNKEVEDAIISAFLEVVVKLSETTFRPLFRKLCDWAFASDDASSTPRKLTFSHIYVALLEYFKALMVPYMSFVWQPILGALEGSAAQPPDGALWVSLVQIVTTTLVNDEGAFWKDSRLRELVPALVRQLPVSVRLGHGDARGALLACAVAAAGAVEDDALLKALNLDVLMHTRAEDARVRVLSLSCAEAMWRAHGGKLLGFTAETATFIVEAAEDENDVVVKEARKLKNAVESIAGKLDI